MDPREYIPDFTWPAGTDAVDFQVAGREDGEEINALFNRSFEQRRSAAHYAWKFWDGPGGAPHGVIAVEKEGGKVLAIATGVAKKVWLDGRERRTLLLCETSSDPAARGGGKLFRGAMAGLASTIVEDAGIRWCFGGQSTDTAIKVGKRWFGYHELFVLQPWEFRLSIEPALRRRLGGLGAALAAPADAVRAAGWKDRAAGCSFEEVSRCGPEFDALFARYRDRYRLVMWRDAETLNWRYFDCPVPGHRILLARRDGEPVGYVVWREWDDEGIRVGTVLDLWDGKDEDLAAALLDAARRAARAGGCRFLRYWTMPGSVEEAALGRFRNARKAENQRPDLIMCTPMCGRGVDTQPPEYLEEIATVVDPSSWYYAQGDCDYRD